MAIALYWGSGSPFAWRVMLMLEVKGLSYESKLLEFSKGQHKTPEFLRLNPRGKVPTLKDGDFVIHESIAIMAYLDRKYPEPSLFGSTAEECGLVWRAISECESYLVPEADKVIRPLFFGKGLDRTEEIQRAAQLVRDELQSSDNALAGSKWLVDARISAADIVLFPVVQSLLRAATKEAAQSLDLGLAPLGNNYPNLGRWARQIEALPNYQRTYPPHWKQ